MCRSTRRLAVEGARTSGTPFISFYAPGQILQIARDAGFRDARHMPGAELRERYFTGRTDELRPSSGEDLLIATANPAAGAPRA